jgi:hypothetical protein
MPNAETIRRFASDPLAFFMELVIPSAVKGKAKVRFGEVMTPEQKERFALLAPSLLALARGESPPFGRFWLECVKGWSKTSDIAACVLWLAAFSTRMINGAQIAAADQDQAAEGKKAALDLLHLNPWLGERVKIREWKITCAATCFEAEIIAADESGSHGGRPLFLWIDEVHAIQNIDFLQNLLDNADKIDGIVICSTNAGFVGTECWRLREIARTSERWKFLQITTPPPWISAAKLAEAQRRNSHSRYLRLWFGVWSAGTGDALDPADIDSAIEPSLSPMSGSPIFSREKARNPLLPRLQLEAESPAPSIRQPTVSFSFVAGLDLGIKHDHSALVILAADHTTQRIRLAFCESWAPDEKTGKVDLMAVEEAVADAHSRFHFASAGFDPYQAELMAQRLIRRGVPMREMPFVGAKLNTMATVLLETFRSRRIDLYPAPQLEADLRRLTIVEKSYGHKLEATRDIDGHADTATALAICLPAAVELASQPYGPGSVIQVAMELPSPNTSGFSQYGLGWSYY